MRRPCVITHPVVVNDGKPFEALQMDLSFHINDLDIYLLDYDDAKNDFNFHQVFTFNTLKELEVVKYLLQWQLAKALNPPIKATDAVLDAMKEEYLNESYYFIVGEYRNQKIHVSYLRNINPVHLLGEKIIADCPLALQVLLQFNEEGENHA